MMSTQAQRMPVPTMISGVKIPDECNQENGWYKDWCAPNDDDGSTALGSGLARFPLNASSLCSSTTSAAYPPELADVTDIDVYFKDLMLFQLSLQKPIGLVEMIFQQADPDLAIAFGVVSALTADLIESARRVVTNYALTAKHVRFEMLPHLSQAKRHAAVTILGGVQHWITSQRKAAKSVRRDYVELLSRVNYMIACTDASVAGQYSETANGDTPQAQQPAMQQAARPNLSCMEVALLHLHSVVRVLEECSDFWLVLHSTERTLHWMEDEAQHLRTRLLDGSKRADVYEQLANFCGSLQQLCLRYCCTTRFAWEAQTDVIEIPL